MRTKYRVSEERLPVKLMGGSVRGWRRVGRGCEAGLSGGSLAAGFHNRTRGRIRRGLGRLRGCGGSRRRGGRPGNRCGRLRRRLGLGWGRGLVRHGRLGRGRARCGDMHFGDIHDPQNMTLRTGLNQQPKIVRARRTEGPRAEDERRSRAAIIVAGIFGGADIFDLVSRFDKLKQAGLHAQDRLGVVVKIRIRVGPRHHRRRQKRCGQ